MAHQAHNIPWTVLASQLKWRLSNRCNKDATNFHWRFRDDQDKQVNYFINAFARNVKDHADCERRKYSENDQGPPQRDDIVIDDDVAKRILPTVHRWRRSNSRYRHVRETPERHLCTHEKGDKRCRCVLPLEERRMSSFLRKHRWNDCYQFFEINKESFLNLEIVKILLLHGEMNTILRVCSHPDVDLENWWEQAQCMCVGPDLGWEHICKLALDSYILLNLLHCFPETWDPPLPRQNDYRRTKAYQYLVRQVTMGDHTSVIPTYPHRTFFGIEDNQFSEFPKFRDKDRWSHLTERFTSDMYPYGHMPFEEFLTCEKEAGHMPSSHDIVQVRWTLCKQGLPVEIADIILKEASYTPKRSLPVPHHPFHPDNRHELDEYLKECWKLIVRCAVMGRALKMEIPWHSMILGSLQSFFTCSCFFNRARTSRSRGASQGTSQEAS